MTHKFKDGDRVRMGSDLGTVVMNGNEPDGLCKVRFDCDGETWWAHEDTLVPVVNDEEDPVGTHIVIDIGENSASARYMKGTEVIRSFETAGNIRGETEDEFDTVLTLIKNLFPNGRLRMVSADDCPPDESEDHRCAPCVYEEEMWYGKEVTIPGFIKLYDRDEDNPLCTFLSAKNISHISERYNENGDGYTEISTSSGDVLYYPAPIDEFAEILLEALDE